MAGDATFKKLLPFKIRFKWVKAHQDAQLDQTKIDELPEESQLNIQVDAMAGSYRSSMQVHIPTIKFPKGDLWIGIGGTYHHHFPAKAIRKKFLAQPSKNTSATRRHGQ